MTNNFTKSRLDICNICEYQAEGFCILCSCELIIKASNSEEFCPLPQPRWGKQSEVVISKPEIESIPAQVPILESTAPPNSGRFVFLVLLAAVNYFLVC